MGQYKNLAIDQHNRQGELVDYEDLGKFCRLMGRHPFQFAKTLWRNPHYYTLLRKWSTPEDFFFCVKFIRKHGFIEIFPPGKNGKPYTIFQANGFKYWSMGAPVLETILINRKPADYTTDYCEIAETYDAMFERGEFKQETEDAMALVGEVGNQRILDIGAGTGAFLDYRKHDITAEKYVALDPSRRMTQKLVEKHPTFKDSVVTARFEDYANGQFDLIISMFGSANYVKPPVLKHLLNMLTPGWRFVLMLLQPDYFPVSLAGRTSSHFHTLEILDTFQHPSLETLDFNKFQVISGTRAMYAP